jgi:peptidoglycan/xylan/chitin deacetylase (PgdA/CDA1 family)
MDQFEEMKESIQASMQTPFQEPVPELKKGNKGLLIFAIILLTILTLTVNYFVFEDVVDAFLAANFPVLVDNGFIEPPASEGNSFNQYPNEDYDSVLDKMKGKIPILEYHIIETPSVDTNYIFTKRIKKNAKTERFFISSSEFRYQLETLYSNNFRNISLDEYISLLKGKKKELNRLPPESKLYVITFDDGTFGQFDIMGTNGQGEYVIDPECAVGIMIDFARKYPDFKLNAAFCVTFDHAPFMQPAYVGQKLNMLLDLGFEIVNHTTTHKKFSRLLARSPEKAAYEIGRAMELFESYLGYRANTIDKICYPYGATSPAAWEFVRNVHFNGKEYHFTAALDATGLQAKNPNAENYNQYNIARIEINNSTFHEFILDAGDLYKTPAVLERDPNVAVNRIVPATNDMLDLIKLR